MTNSRWEDEEKANYTVEALRSEFRERLYGTEQETESLNDEPIESLFDDNGDMKPEHLAQTAQILKELAAKMEANPGSDPFDHLGDKGMNELAQRMIEPLRPHW